MALVAVIASVITITIACGYISYRTSDDDDIFWSIVIAVIALFISGLISILVLDVINSTTSKDQEYNITSVENLASFGFEKDMVTFTTDTNDDTKKVDLQLVIININSDTREKDEKTNSNTVTVYEAYNPLTLKTTKYYQFDINGPMTYIGKTIIGKTLNGEVVEENEDSFFSITQSH